MINPSDIPAHRSPYRWYILILSALTNTLVIALPTTCLAVLFKEISTDLGLNLVQVGMVWGFGALPGLVTNLVGGGLGDRFGPRRILPLACLLAGLAGGLRGLSAGFASLLVTVFLLGLLTPVVSMNLIKLCGTWFGRGQLGLANGTLSMGMALGFMLGSLLSATVISPWLGGWRNVLLFYGVIAVLFCIPWYFVRPLPVDEHPLVNGPASPSMRQAMTHVAGIRNVWLLGMLLFFFNGSIQGLLGYLPLYLRGLGWAPAGADGATASFHALSMAFVLPIALLSDRLGSRRRILLAAVLMTALGVGLLSVFKGPEVWAAVIMAGMVRDGFMGVYLTMVIETEGVGARYAGTATGLVMVFANLGNIIAPPAGNSLASIAPGIPFLFWALLAVLGVVVLFFTREKTGEKVAVPAP